MDWYIILAIILMAVIVYKLSKRTISSASSQTIQDERSSQIIKGLNNCADISNSIRQLHDKELVDMAKKLQKCSDKIMNYLRQNPQSIHAAQRFIDYYQDRTALLLRKCVMIEQTGINSPESKDIMHRTKATLQDFSVAYEKQFVKITMIQLNDIGAELKVAQQILNEDGIESGSRQLEKEVYYDQEVPTMKPEECNSSFSIKTVGAVALTILGGIGLYKFLGNKNDNKK